MRRRSERASNIKGLCPPTHQHSCSMKLGAGLEQDPAVSGRLLSETWLLHRDAWLTGALLRVPHFGRGT